jgi:VWFA-related protein
VGGLLAVLGIVILASAQTLRTSEQRGEVIELRSDLVSFTASVIGPDGKSLTSLKAENFIVYENGERQVISHFSTVDTPVDVVVAIDVSGSMQADVEVVKKAAIGFIERLRRQDRVAVVEFSREVTLLQDFTHDRKKARDALKRLRAGTATAFYDALSVIADELLGTVGTRKALIVLSDGVDSISFYDFSQASGKLERAGVAASFIEIDTEQYTVAGVREGRFALSPQQLERYRRTYRPDDLPLRYRNPSFFFPDELAEITRGLYRLARQEIRQLALRTGGRVYPLRTLTDLRSIYDQIAAELGTLYSLGYYPTNQRHDGTWRSLRVEVTVPGAQVTARSGYWAPAR